MKRCFGFVARAVAYSPHPKKRSTGGEDAYVAMPTLVGVADGVGSWADRGVDASKYSRALMKHCFDKAYEHAMQGDELQARELLRYAAGECADIQGSSTAALATLSGTTVEVCNLGDSGCLILRDGKVEYRTEEQQHRLNFPFQLGTGSRDTPDDAVCAKVEVAEHDIVCVASDGILDNIYTDDIVRVIAKAMEDVKANDHKEVQKRLTAAANKLVALAESNALDRKAATPFAEKCLEAGMSIEGGKVDDTTVVLAMVDESLYDEGERTNEGQADMPKPHMLWPI
jgi:protein phosphatase PTC7